MRPPLGSTPCRRICPRRLRHPIRRRRQTPFRSRCRPEARPAPVPPDELPIHRGATPRRDGSPVPARWRTTAISGRVSSLSSRSESTFASRRSAAPAARGPLTLFSPRGCSPSRRTSRGSSSRLPHVPDRQSAPRRRQTPTRRGWAAGATRLDVRDAPTPFATTSRTVPSTSLGVRPGTSASIRTALAGVRG